MGVKFIPYHAKPTTDKIELLI